MEDLRNLTNAEGLTLPETIGWGLDLSGLNETERFKVLKNKNRKSPYKLAFFWWR
jgi:hypothetical protein